MERKIGLICSGPYPDPAGLAFIVGARARMRWEPKASNSYTEKTQRAGWDKGWEHGYGDTMKARKKTRRWRARVMLLSGRIVNVEKRDGRQFNSGMFASNEGPIQVEIREIR